jgi:hypothetical protein
VVIERKPFGIRNSVVMPLAKGKPQSKIFQNQQKPVGNDPITKQKTP